jgi:hypothetical protein
MGFLVEGHWREEELPNETDRAGVFQRSDSQFRANITADGSSGFKAQAGRYHLYVAYNCPWAHRTLIFRALKNLEGAITLPMRYRASTSRAGCSKATHSSRSVPRTGSMASATSTRVMLRHRPALTVVTSGLRDRANRHRGRYSGQGLPCAYRPDICGTLRLGSGGRRDRNAGRGPFTRLEAEGLVGQPYQLFSSNFDVPY